MTTQRALAYGLAQIILLGVAYPPTGPSAAGRPTLGWLGTHACMGVIVTLFALVSCWASERLFRRTWVRGVATAMLTLSFLALYALTVGSVTAQTLEALPLESVHTEFFREFRSVKFAFVVAPCAAALTALLIRPDRMSHS